MASYDRKRNTRKSNAVASVPTTFELTTWLCDNNSKHINCLECGDVPMSFNPQAGRLECSYYKCRYGISARAFYKKKESDILSMYREMKSEVDSY